MLKINKLLIAVCIFVGAVTTASAQNSTNSPYTRFGYGQLADRSFGAGRSMGGVGYGLRSSRQINPMNPASYSVMDSMTFLFDAGASFQMSWFNDGTNRSSDINGNFEYVALQFPLSRRIAISAGLMPYSHVGYTFSAISSDGPGSLTQFSGTGGLNDVFVGASIDIWKKRLAVGANIAYMFGKVDHRRSITTTNTMYTMNKTEAHSLGFDIGLQYTHPLTKTERLTFGAVYSPARELKTTRYDLISNDEYFLSSMIQADTATNEGFGTPDTYGFGVTFTKDYKLIVAADVSYQTWQGTKIPGTDNAKDRLKVAVGGEYIPNNSPRLYMNRVRYRAGLHYSNSYFNVNGSGYDELGVSLGAGFPMLDNRSFINASFEYVKIVPAKTNVGLINEQYFRFTLSYTFNEFWFMKRKID